MTRRLQSLIKNITLRRTKTSKIKGKPVKQIKIGNGFQTYDELKSIIILDNADFIIVDRDGNIIDYITNGGYLSITSLAD